MSVQHNSRRAELHRLQERHPELAARLQARELEADNDDDTESSSSEEEVRHISCGVLNNAYWAIKAADAVMDSPSGVSSVTD